ncbi:MAG: hypothetical protein V9F82_07600 [Dermatophilaceae bacterium]
MPELRFQEQRNAEMALAFTEEPYGTYVTIEGTPHKDLYAVDLKTGDKKLIVKDLRVQSTHFAGSRIHYLVERS